MGELIGVIIFWIILAFVAWGIARLLKILNDHKVQKLISKLSEDVKAYLRDGQNRHLLKSEEHEHINSKRKKEIVSIFCVIIVGYIVAGFQTGFSADYGKVVIVTAVILLIATVIIVSKEKRQITTGYEDGTAWVSKAYIISWTIYEGKTLLIAYYDHVEEEIVGKSVHVGGDETGFVQRGDYIDIILTLKNGSLKYGGVL